MTTLALITLITPIGSAWAQSAEAPSSKLPSLQLPSWEQLSSWELPSAGLGTWSGSLELSFASERQAQHSANAAASTSSNLLFKETFKIANDGFYVVSPRLWTGRLGLVLGLDQNKNSSTGTSTASRDQLIGYSFYSTFLAEKPYTASVFANRNQSQYLQPFGGHREATLENRGANFSLRENSVLKDWGFLWFESRLSLTSGHNTSTTTIFGQSLKTDETSKKLEFHASKGFETADLGLGFQVNDQHNQEFSYGNFQSKAANLVYSLDFGPNLTRRFDSYLGYLTRNGSSPSTTTSAREHLHIDHSRNLNTDYDYGFTQQDLGGTTSTRQNGTLTLAHQLYTNLNTTAALNGSSSTLANGSTTFYGGRLNQVYHHSLPGKGSFFASWSGSYQLTDNKLSTSSISVFEEAHNAPSPLVAGAGFLIDHSFVVAASIVVWDARGGGRIPVTAGVDYDAVTEGSQIRIVPRVSSLLILAGDPLVVDYNYQVDRNLKYETKGSGFGIGVDYRWIAVAYNHQQSDQTPLSGTSQFLDSRSLNNLRISSRGSLLAMDANASLDFDNYKSNITAYRGRKFASSLFWDVNSYMKMMFGLNASETQYTLPIQHKSDSRSARTSLDWYTPGGWDNSASLDWSRNSDSGIPSQTLMQARLQSKLAVGQLTLTSGLNYSEWLRGGSRSTSLNLFINAVRQF